jgi:hypothetical protein
LRVERSFVAFHFGGNDGSQSEGGAERIFGCVHRCIGHGGWNLGAIQTWNGGGADDNWTTSGNWLGGTAPVANDALLFDGSVRLTPNNNFAAGTRRRRRKA